MSASRKKAESPSGHRYDELKQMLVERQREIMSELDDRKRHIRQAGADRVSNGKRPTHGGDDESNSDEDEIEIALIQMKAETLAKINEALERLEEGTYGNCFECGDGIAQPRLRALPFAVRCKDCEEAREMAQQRERVMARRGSSPLGFDMLG